MSADSVQFMCLRKPIFSTCTKGSCCKNTFTSTRYKSIQLLYPFVNHTYEERAQMHFFCSTPGSYLAVPSHHLSDLWIYDMAKIYDMYSLGVCLPACLSRMTGYHQGFSLGSRNPQQRDVPVNLLCVSASIVVDHFSDPPAYHKALFTPSKH